MDLKTYELIIAICKKQLHSSWHGTYLEDCIQDCAMQYLEGRTNIKWSVIDFCRKNGIGKRGKHGAIALNRSLSINAPGASEESEDSYYLLDRESISRSDREEQFRYRANSTKGILEEFLGPLNLKKETLRWAMSLYKVKMN